MRTAGPPSRPGRACARVRLQGWTFLPKHTVLLQLEILLPGRSTLRNGHGGAPDPPCGTGLRIGFLGPASGRGGRGTACTEERAHRRSGGHQDGILLLASYTGAWAALLELSSPASLHPAGSPRLALFALAAGMLGGQRRQLL